MIAMLQGSRCVAPGRKVIVRSNCISGNGILITYNCTTSSLLNYCENDLSGLHDKLPSPAGRVLGPCLVNGWACGGRPLAGRLFADDEVG